MTHNKNPRRRLLVNLALSTCMSLFCVFAAEGVLRYLNDQPIFRVWRPGISVDLTPAPKYLPGVEGPTRVRVNSQGLRSSEDSSTTDLRVLAIGGRTTECIYLDQDETWTALLQGALRREGLGKDPWVGNAGKGGQHAGDHLLQLTYLPRNLPKPDAVVSLVGVNDFQRFLMSPAEALADRVDQKIRPESRCIMRFPFFPEACARSIRIGTRT